MTKEIKAEITKFIEDNKLDFDQTGSGLNSACCILSGFALYKSVNDSDDLVTCIDKLDLDGIRELEKVLDFADKHRYGEFWKTEQATKEYVFTLNAV